MAAFVSLLLVVVASSARAGSGSQHVAAGDPSTTTTETTHAATPTPGATATTLGGVVTIATTTVPQEADAPWQEITTMPNEPHGVGWASEGIKDISCPSEATCIAVGYSRASNSDPSVGDILRTTDAGSTWTPTETGPVGSAYASIECIEEFICIVGGAVGGHSVLMHSDDSGATWTEAELPESRGLTITSISCRTSQQCMAVRPIDMATAEILASTDGGRSWTLEESGGFSGPATAAVNCVPNGPCVLSLGHYSYPQAAFYVTVDLGATWEPVALPDNVHWLGEVSCSSSTDCLSLGVEYHLVAIPLGAEEQDGSATEIAYSNAVYTTSDGGLTWSRVDSDVDRATPMKDLDCISATSCYAILSNLSTASSIYVTHDGGLSWTAVAETNDGGILNAIACSPDAHCYAVGGGPLDVIRPALLLGADTSSALS
jgi:photosystem II stability/assembly factor-like uncharacterized protein